MQAANEILIGHNSKKEKSVIPYDIKWTSESYFFNYRNRVLRTIRAIQYCDAYGELNERQPTLCYSVLTPWEEIGQDMRTKIAVVLANSGMELAEEA